MPHSARSPCNQQVTVEHIGTEPIGPQQREQAIAALATLITVFQHSQADEQRADLAAPLPLPGPASDTDHAA